ncbi:AraC family transcriptional regulator [Mariniflexile sp. HNIBRBA6329]|uniref:AraC family transcriptional regulator n=1 Tax=Mariniflexile sp. HNIBRBA6329 TaxID=3373088 RepID=UPI003746B6A1
MTKNILDTEKKAIVLPKGIIKELKENNLTKSLLVTDIGYYPKSKGHSIYRKNGSLENILIYCTEGKGWIEINNKRQAILENEYIIISPKTPHRYGSDYHDPWSIYWIHFIGEKAHLFVNYPNEKLRIDLDKNARFSDRILLFEEIFNNLGMGYSMDNLEYANICLWHMLGSFRYLSQFRKIKELQTHDRIEKSIRYMKNHISEKLSLEMMSNHVGLSVSQFCVLFKKKTSRTPLDYLTYIRIEQASKLLDFSGLKINEIAIEVGYPDPFYFSRIFSKIMGKSPKHYRNFKKG